MLLCTNPQHACLSPPSLLSNHYHNKAACPIITYTLFSWQWGPCCWPIVLSQHSNEWQKLSADLIIWPTKYPSPHLFTVVTPSSSQQTHTSPPRVGRFLSLPSLFRLSLGHPFVQLVCAGVCRSSTQGCSLLMRAFKGWSAAGRRRYSAKDFPTSCEAPLPLMEFKLFKTDTKEMRL